MNANSMQKKSRLKFFTILICSLLGLEVILRLIGFILTQRNPQLNLLEARDQSKIKILALGESSTAEFQVFSRGSWPRRMEEDLKARGYQVKVFNEALAGTSTPMILSKLPAYLEKYKPHLVVTMMGINDDGSIKYEGINEDEFYLLLKSLRVWKLTTILHGRIMAALHCSFDDEELDLIKYGEFLVSEYENLNPADPKSVEQRLRAKMQDEKLVGLGMTFLGMKMISSAGKYPSDVSDRFTHRGFELLPYNHRTVFMELAANSSNTNGHCKDVAKHVLACGPNVSDDLLSMVTTCFRVNKVDQEISNLKDRHLKSLKDNRELLGYHYRMLNDMLRGAGVHHIAMQYPTLQLEDLQRNFQDSKGSILPDYQNITFVSNQENFAKALERYKYDEIFSDRFRGSWGHTRDIGYDLLSQSAAQAVMKVLENKTLLKK